MKLKRLEIEPMRFLNPRYLFLTALPVCGAAFCLCQQTASTAFYVVLTITLFVTAIACFQISKTNHNLVYLTVLLILISSMVINIRVTTENKSFVYPTQNVDSVTCTLMTPFSVNGDQAEAVVRVSDDRYNGEWTLIVTNAEAMPNVDLGAVIKLSNVVISSNVDLAEGVLTTDESDRNLMEVCYSDCLISNERGGNAFERIRFSILKQMNLRMSDEEFGTAAALLFGDKSYMSYGVYRDYRDGGLAHIMAVSGLHVGILFGILNFLFGKQKKGKLWSFIPIALIAVFYCLICGGSVSVVRAVIMGLLAMFGTLIGRRSDSLNNLSIAAIVILAIDPTLILNLSFSMSFISVLSIILLSAPIEKGLKKIKIPTKVASPCAVTLSATVGLMPLTAACFHTVNLWSILTNFVALPLVGLVYVLLLVMLLPSLLWSGFMVAPSFCIRVLNGVAAFFASLPAANFVVFSMGLASIPFYVALFSLSRIILYPDKVFAGFAKALSLVTIVLVMVFTNLPISYTSLHVGAVSYGSNVSAIVSVDGKTAVLGSSAGLYKADDFLTAQRIRKVDLIVFNDLSDVESIKNFIKRFNVKHVVLDTDATDRDEWKTLGSVYLLTEDDLTLEGFVLSSPQASANLYLQTDVGAVGVVTGEPDITAPYCVCVVSKNPLANMIGSINLIPETPSGMEDGSTLTSDGNFVSFMI